MIERAIKEFGIANLLSEARAEDKVDYINRWLLQNLRASPLEVRVLLSSWPASLRIINLRRWQEDVLYFWTRDAAANIPESVFNGPQTPNSYLTLEEDLDEMS